MWKQEYPRPQLRRDRFLSLNGPWVVNNQTVEVPFPPQSALSGWQGDVPDELAYHRTFTLPEGFLNKGERLILHFGAVDQIAEVFLNGHPIMRHEGGYLPFSADITAAVLGGENALTVLVTDTLNQDYPYGKQCKKPHGMWYTPVSGIWQSVWLEPVPQTYIRSLRITPALDSITLNVDADAPDCQVDIPGVLVQTIPCGQDVKLRIPQPHLWTVDDPYLYDLVITAGNDRVESYFALRTVEILPHGNTPAICLNGTPVFLSGVLDQGYFPDGIFLPEDPAEFARDVQRMKALGFNLLRKHIKIEPETFYFACDRLGMLVMQDMVNNGPYTFFTDTALPTIGMKKRPDRFPWGKKRKEIFLRHSEDTIRHLYNHPCIVGYTIFNEGWGQFDSDQCYAVLKALDPTRFWDATSGWFIRHDSDLQSEHIYFRNTVLKSGGRPMLLSECGGFARPMENHLSDKKQYGYGTAATEEALTDHIEQMHREMILPSIPHGLCGYIYTQLSDVEGEINGLYTYDRSECKVDVERMRKMAQGAERAFARRAQRK
ncbi:MAG: glycoside hydrolase family 2 [Clostridiales bacterium]|nr:glycoside hydrolase family 2 [Clostridiales bacterium]